MTADSDLTGTEKILMTLEFCNGTVKLIDNERETITMDLKEGNLAYTKETIYRYLRHVLNGLHQIYFVEGYRYD